MSAAVTQLATSAALISGPPGQPDISYAPNWEKYQARIQRQLQLPNRPTTLPPGLPAKLHGPLVWDRESLVREEYKWTYEFTAAQLDEIEAALAHFKSLNIPHGRISQQTFPLPTLHAVLRRLSHDLHLGHGFFVLRGVDVDAHSRADNIAIYAGLSAHIAPVRGRQDRSFSGVPADVTLTHIRDVQSANTAATIGSPAYTADKQVFHTDSGDVVSLFALGTAEEGGESLLASTWRVYNEIAATRPDIVHTLVQDWPFEMHHSFTNPRQLAPRPLLFHQPATAAAPERIALQYARRGLVGFGALPRSADMPPISEAQAEALDTLHFLGEKYCVQTNFQKGDMQYVNNLGVFHARQGFRDSPENTRHLVRLWLRDPEYAWETPVKLKERWSAVYDGVKEENQVLPLEPFFRSNSSNKT
ncbi:hypothetical protein TD95_002431 [Thielaviopsis punctulata]|uniref:TauD/TfdA-like domain-containing protein n=1 Tax=Thielaviopsis punctulata TaxID=72032 RepID=A0A0F4ZCH2_9PEZI|nr:hypothetical protein TD95_002431 [Thielaviopsis punctulata]